MKTVTEALNENPLFSTIFSSVSCMVIGLDDQGRFVLLNKYAEEVSGYSFKELDGKLLWDVLLFDYERVYLKELFGFLILGNINKSKYDFFLRNPSGDRRMISWDISSVSIDNSKYIICVGTDITDKEKTDSEKKIYEEDLKMNEEKYRKLVDSAPDAIVLYDYESKRILDVNKKACEIFKTNRDEIIRSKPSFFTEKIQPTGHHYREQSYKYLQEAIKGNDPVFEWVYKDSQGNNIPTEVSLTRLPSNEKILIRASIIDISERKNAENKINEFIIRQGELLEKIRSKEESLSGIINSTSDLIFSVDRNFCLQEFNNAFAHSIKRHSGKELKKGTCIWDSIDKDYFEKTLINFERCFAGESVDFTMEVSDRSGKYRIMSVVYSPVFSSGIVNTVVVSIRDITDKKLAEHQLTEINKQMAEYKLMALRSVMNPHFLFNSLNSIQYFITTYERKLALNYLSIFSTLIRKVLDSSVNQKVKLSTEIEILKNYIELEMVRFDHKFDLEFEIGNFIDPDQIEVPSLLIQPYVENAILHGLNTQSKRGLLKIVILNENGYLVVMVEDNGIGRKKAQQIKDSHHVKLKSYGMMVTKERLEIINKASDVSVIIEDLYDQNGNGAGTRVKIFVKI